MRRLLLAVPVLFVAALLLLPPRPAAGCAVAPREGRDVHISSETALIVYDAATKTEHFIRTANFQTTSADFGFLVPTPGKPDLFDSSAEVFGELVRITAPRTEKRTRMVDLNFGCGPASSMVAGKADVQEAGVSVIEQKRVGDFDATTLQASDPKKLRDWLYDHGYPARLELEAWLANYTAGGWYVTAFKIAAYAPKGSDPHGVKNSAVRISFPTDRPFYPYRESADMQSDKTHRSLRVFVLSDQRVSGSIGLGEGAKAWPGRTEWANAVPAERLATVVAKAKLPESVSRRGWNLTEFLDSSSPRPGTDELYFEPATDRSVVERPPHIEWEVYDPWPWVCIGVLVLMVLTLIVVIWRMAWRR